MAYTALQDVLRAQTVKALPLAYLDYRGATTAARSRLEGGLSGGHAGTHLV